MELGNFDLFVNHTYYIKKLDVLFQIPWYTSDVIRRYRPWEEEYNKNIMTLEQMKIFSRDFNHMPAQEEFFVPKKAPKALEPFNLEVLLRDKNSRNFDRQT